MSTYAQMNRRNDTIDRYDCFWMNLLDEYYANVWLAAKLAARTVLYGALLVAPLTIVGLVTIAVLAILHII